MTESMTQAELDAIDAAEREATPGPWGFVPGSVNCPDWDADSIAVVGYSEQDGNNSAFIALSRTAVPRMRGEIDRLKALVEQESRRADEAYLMLAQAPSCESCLWRNKDKKEFPCKDCCDGDRWSGGYFPDKATYADDTKEVAHAD